MPRLTEAEAECERRLAETLEIREKLEKASAKKKSVGLSDEARIAMEEKLNLM